MIDQDFRALNAELGFPSEAADRLLHDRRADERRERAAREADREHIYGAISQAIGWKLT